MCGWVGVGVCVEEIVMRYIVVFGGEAQYWSRKRRETEKMRLDDGWCSAAVQLSASCRLRVDVNGRSGDNEPNSLRLQSTRTSGRYHRWRRLFQMLVPNYHDITSTYTSATTASAAASATIIILRSPIIWKRINAYMQQLSLLLLSLSLNVTIVNANDNDYQLFYYICSWNYRVNQTIARL